MRLTTVILIASLIQVSASTFGQRITMNKQNISLKTVLREITKQSGYGFFYDGKVIGDNQKVGVNISNAEIDDALKNVLAGLSLTYRIEGRIISIKKEADPSFIERIVSRFQAIDVNVTGILTDSLGQPLPGATVYLKGVKSYSVLTNNIGQFTFSAIQIGSYELNITYVGYQKLQTTIAVTAETKNLRFIMNQATSVLDQVQVIAYGNNTRRFNVGSVSTISAETIGNQPVTNLLSTLQGQVPGLTITNTTNAPGSAVKVQIRGQNSLAGDQNSAKSPAFKPFDQPLFIIDGVPSAAQNKGLGMLFTYDLTSTISSNTPGNGISAFANINPADIESITVLRDADATSIYGSQGANGVILITTKKGKPGKPNLNVTVNTGSNVGTRRLDMLNTEQYLAFRREAVANDKITLTPFTVNTYPDLQLFDQNRYADWYKEFFDKNPITTDVHASFSGGQQNSTFILSGGYTNTPYNFAGNFKSVRLSLHSGFTYRSPDNKLSVQFITDYAYNKNNAGANPKVTTAMSMVPNFPALLDDKDNLLWNYKGFNLSTYNQYALLRQPADVQPHNLNTSVRLSYEVIPGLSLSSNLGYNRTTTSSYSAFPRATQSPSFPFVRASFGTNIFQSLNVEPQLDYKRTLGRGEFTFLAGGTYRKSNSYSTSINASGYTNDDLLKSISGATSFTAFNASSINKYAGAYARVGYVYDRKYILNLTGRRDGSTNFGPGRRWGSFGSVGAGWIFSDEDFWPKKALSFVSFGKLSGNFGTNGSDGVAPYKYQPYYAVDPSSITLPYQNIRSYTPDNLYNPNYSWALKKSWNVALDLGFFNDKLLTNFTWYKNSTANQLMDYTLPSQTGFNYVAGNFPATVQNTGLEFGITSTNVQTKNFRWTTNFNISGNRNKLAAFPDLETSPYAVSYVVGRSTNILQGYRYAGVNSTTGLFEFYNAQGEKTSSPAYSHVSQGGDQGPILDLDPKFGGGLGNNFTYKNLTLSVFFQFSKQKGRSWLGGMYAFGQPGSLMNVPVEALDHWRNPGDISEMQQITSSYGNAYYTGGFFANSDGAYTDASYVRLKTISIRWAFPESFTRKIGIKNFSLFCNAQNLFTITNYKVGDPEMAGAIYSLPLQRTIAAGLSANF